LPDPPGAIDLGVVKPESWVTWRGEEIAAWVTTNGVVAAGVHTVEAISEWHTVDNALHVLLERLDVGVVLDEGDGLIVSGPPAGDPLADVAAQEARLVGEPAGGRDARGGKSWGDWGDVHDHVLEGSRGDATTASSGRNAVRAGWKGVGAVVLSVDAVARHGVGGAIEDWGINWVLGSLAPVPVL